MHMLAWRCNFLGDFACAHSTIAQIEIRIIVLGCAFSRVCQPARCHHSAARPGPETLVAQGETQFEALNTNIYIKHFLILSVDAYFLDKIVVNL